MQRISTDALRARLAEVRRFIANGDTGPAEGAEQLSELERQLTAVELHEAAEAKKAGLRQKDERRAMLRSQRHA